MYEMTDVALLFFGHMLDNGDLKSTKLTQNDNAPYWKMRTMIGGIHFTHGDKYIPQVGTMNISKPYNPRYKKIYKLKILNRKFDLTNYFLFH